MPIQQRLQTGCKVLVIAAISSLDSGTFVISLHGDCRGVCEELYATVRLLVVRQSNIQGVGPQPAGIARLQCRNCRWFNPKGLIAHFGSSFQP